METIVELSCKEKTLMKFRVSSFEKLDLVDAICALSRQSEFDERKMV